MSSLFNIRNSLQITRIEVNLLGPVKAFTRSNFGCNVISVTEVRYLKSSRRKIAGIVPTLSLHNIHACSQ